MKKKSLSLPVVIFLLLLSPLLAAAEESTTQSPGYRWRGGRSNGDFQPYGNYCPRRHADNYGARQPVHDIDGAQRRLAEFFNVTPAEVLVTRELKMGYIADILKNDGTVSYRVFIDKRSGRIRSIR